MSLYSIQETAQRGQVLLVSEDKRGVIPFISLQMPEIRAKQIVEALQIVENLSKLSEDHIEDVAGCGNIIETLKTLRYNCQKVIQYPIEKN